MGEMDMQPTALNRAPTAIAKLLPTPLLLSKIAKLLTILSETRQASISGETLKLYSSHLARHPVEDIKAAVEKLSLIEREPGETAFPALATVNRAVLDAGRDRRLAVVAAERIRREQEEERDRIAHPENYVSMAEIVGGFYETKSMRTELQSGPIRIEGPAIDRIMAHLSAGLEAGTEYEPKVVEEIKAWRQTQEL